MGANVVEGGQPLGRDGVDDLALAHAVAAADFRFIWQRCNGRRRVQGGTPGVAGTEDERLAHLRDVGSPLQQIEKPRSIGGITVEHRADEFAVLAAQAACKCRARRRAARSPRGPGPRAKSPAEKRLMPVTLSLVAVALGVKRAAVSPMSWQATTPAIS